MDYGLCILWGSLTLGDSRMIFISHWDEFGNAVGGIAWTNVPISEVQLVISVREKTFINQLKKNLKIFEDTDLQNLEISIFLIPGWGYVGAKTRKFESVFFSGAAKKLTPSLFQISLILNGELFS